MTRRQNRRHKRGYRPHMKHGAEKRIRERRERQERERDHRDRLVSAMHGEHGHGTCGRKAVYHSYEAVQRAIRRNEGKSDTELFAYKCGMCGGWHLTSHPRVSVGRGGRRPMTVIEVLSEAREAALEIRRIEIETSERMDACGIGARSYEAHGPLGSTLDPMRKVDELVDWQAAQIATRDLERPIIEAAQIVAGIDACGDTLAVEVVTRYYLQGESWHRIVADVAPRYEHFDGMSTHDAAEMLHRALTRSLAEWDSVGIARLKEMGER